MDFFFYGTLMDPDVLSAVLGRPLAPEALRPAVLVGYRRCAIRERGYPMLLRSRSGNVGGVLAGGLDEADALRLTWYESDGYEIRLCSPALADGGSARAWIFLPRAREMSPGGSWSLGVWQRQHKEAWLAAFERERGAGEPSPAALAAARAAWRRRRAC